ncbi:bifunctional diguanylate cyclase/phosphodiesterase [Mycobacterium sp.]|uniref:putative bifunctional diguanylate cyclase/phosphodiesterase n=1 Tax=Mycobacterium sp. TaxID=1785 RepID=UPI002D52E9C6|nr:bifunctional diguanylate cyclase/phosphodiesterase [Mycobacterium sp.]HZA09102.1 bifunctional diguanylate cyclase/phosphodiesterase [Mycobacterium sp.]
MGLPKVAWIKGIAAAAGIVFAAWLIMGWGGASTVRIVDDVGLLIFAVFAAVCVGLAAWSARGRQRAAWFCLTLGIVGWVVGEAVRTYYQVVRGMASAPFPSLADAGFLLFPVGACLALVFFPVGYAGRSQSRLVLDGLIVAGSLFFISWVTVLESVYQAGGANRFALGLSLAYPVADLVIITVAVLVLARAPTGQRMALALLSAGIVFMAASDSAFVYLVARNAYNSGNVIDAGWAAGLLAVSMAALAGRRSPHPDAEAAQVPSQVSLWLPYVPLLLAGAVGVRQFWPSVGSGPTLAVALLLVIAVLARQFIAVGENQRLLVMVADQALRDPLTGLANRTLFHDRLTHAVQLHQRDQRPVAVLSLDLDDFKLVNDTLGHPTGDAVLTRAAERLLGCVRTGDTVARLGGDEFAVLLEGGVEHSHLVAHRVVEAFDEPFVIHSQKLLMRPSLGLAVASADNPGLTADTLLKQADVAMYSAKRSRAGGLHTFTPEIHSIEPDEPDAETESDGAARAGGTGTVRLLAELRDAIDRVDLSVLYQPKFDLRTADVVGVEALVRWPHPERGLLGPDRFLPLVRQHGLMRAVTELVLAQALDDAAHWHSKGIGVPVAVNLFAPSLADMHLPTQIAHALADRHLNADALMVEITEDLLLDNVGRTRAVLHRLRERGIRIAMDDFGSGYSALCYLRELPIDEVKLDRQFIAPIVADPRAAAIVRAVIDLAHVLGVTTVAEGVENAETAGKLREYGCEVAQGFYYSPPVTSHVMLKLLSAPRHNGAVGALPGPDATPAIPTQDQVLTTRLTPPP